MSRKVGNIEIKGINSSNVIPTPGFCSDISNVRLKGNVWENVSDFSVIETVEIPPEYTILYVHDSDDIEKYIAEKDGSIYYIKLGEQTEIVTELCQNINNNSPLVTGFGNYLSIKYTEETPIVEFQYVWYNNSYVAFDLSQLQAINDVEFTNTYKIDDDNSEGMCRVATIVVYDSEDYEVSAQQYSYNSEASVFEDLDYITGVVYLFFAYKLYDGSIVKPSKIYMLQYHPDGHNNIRISVDGNIYYVDIDICGYKSSCEIELSDEIFNTEIVDSIVIYSTRDNQIYDLDKLKLASYMTKASRINNYYYSDVMDYLSDTVKDALLSPFYLLEEYDLTDITDGKISIELTKETFDDIELNDRYVPNYSNHNTTVAGDYEYNNRLHKYGIHTVFTEEINPFYSGVVDGDVGSAYENELTYDETKELVCVVKIVGDTENCYIEHRMPYFEHLTVKGIGIIAFTPVISYPDARAKELTTYYYDITTDKYYKLYSFTLTSSYSLNYSYYISYKQYEFGHYSSMYTYQSSLSELPIINNLLVEKNKIIVSSFGNPYMYEAQHTYFIGEVYSTEIYSLATVLSDNVNETTGIYPLTVFTSDGIYSLEQGESDILYNRIIKVSNDIILENSNILSVNKMLFFISEKGLIYLSGSKVSTASDNFSTEDIEYFKNSKLMLLIYYDEIMAYNESYDYAYVYSISSGFWAKRDISGFILTAKKFYNGTSIVNISSKEDETQPLKPYLLTRAIDYGNIGLVRFDTVVAELRSEGLVSYSFVIYGSLDLENWCIIGYGDDFSKIRRFASSWRYYKFEIDVNKMDNVYDGESESITKTARFYISTIAVEYYSRFAKHLNDNNDGNTSLPQIN